jgi:rare lipoprotein A
MLRSAPVRPRRATRPARAPTFPRLRALSALLALVAAGGCRAAGPPLPPPPPPLPDWTQEGLASWYGEPFHGRTTASGEVFDMEALTAAHRTLPFGTVVEVLNLDNGRSITVRINDRGPFVSGRIIDLSRRAAGEIDMIGAGVVRVRVILVEEAGGDGA